MSIVDSKLNDLKVFIENGLDNKSMLKALDIIGIHDFNRSILLGSVGNRSLCSLADTHLPTAVL